MTLSYNAITGLYWNLFYFFLFDKRIKYLEREYDYVKFMMSFTIFRFIASIKKKLEFLS